MDNYKNDIERYLRGELTPAEMHRLEKIALSDPFLADALDGAAISGPEHFSADVVELHDRIREKQIKRKSLVTPMRIAASIVLLLGISFLLYTVYFQPAPVLAPLAKLEPHSTQPVAAPPKSADSIVSMPVEKQKEKLLSFDRSSAAPEIVREEKKEEENIPVPAPASAIQSLAEATEGKPYSVRIDTIEVAEEIIDVAKEKKSAARSAGPVRMEVSSFDKAKDKAEDDDILNGRQTIRGKVSLANRSPAGVNVSVKGTGVSTRTDAQGYYELPGQKKPGQSLIFSTRGFQTSEVDADEQSNINIQLSDSIGKSSEVVVGSEEPKFNRDDASTRYAAPDGGYRSFDKYLDANLRYPEEARQKKIQGKVLVEFTVKKDSTISGFRVVHGIGAGCDDELIRLIKAGPSWKPLKQSDALYDSKVRVRLKFSLPK